MNAAVITLPAARADVAALLKTWAKSLEHFTEAALACEERRTETLPKSPAAVFMRTAIDAEKTRRASQFRCVVIFDKDGRRDIQAGPVSSKQQAMQQWKWRIASGGYAIGSRHQTLVVTDTVYQHIAAGGAA
jgi:hypothetical protein